MRWSKRSATMAIWLGWLTTCSLLCDGWMLAVWSRFIVTPVRPGVLAWRSWIGCAALLRGVDLGHSPEAPPWAVRPFLGGETVLRGEWCQPPTAQGWDCGEVAASPEITITRWLA